MRRVRFFAVLGILGAAQGLAWGYVFGMAGVVPAIWTGVLLGCVLTLRFRP